MVNARHRWVLGGLLTMCLATLSSATAPPAAEFVDALHARGPLVAGPGPLGRWVLSNGSPSGLWHPGPQNAAGPVGRPAQ